MIECLARHLLIPLELGWSILSPPLPLFFFSPHLY